MPDETYNFRTGKAILMSGKHNFVEGGDAGAVTGAPTRERRVIARPLFVLGVVLACVSGCLTQTRPTALPQDVAPAIIPLPNRVLSSEGSFELRPSTQIAVSADSETRWTAHWLADLLRRTQDLHLRIGDTPSPPSSGVILLELGTLPGDPVPESYRLEVSPDRIVVSANDAAGLFYGAVSVWQLASASSNDGAPTSIPALTIDDAPRFRWRGLMLDPARHFVAPDDVRLMIDWMALHKLNVLHLHLTDDQGWRLEIEQYPRLTEVGAWRIPARASANDSPAQRYGGYYTQDEVRAIVDYAARRHVTIVPEIEMPGHAQAAIAAYPALGTGNGAPPVSPDWGIHDYLFNVDESTFEVLENVLDEVMALFPGEFIHVGGDEAVKQRWQQSERVQARMRELGIADETALQSWFIRRIEEYLNRHGRRLIGWDEILEGGLAPNATVMSWRGIDGALEAAAEGHDTVLTPAPTLYFDHRQSALPREPPGRGPVISLADVYAFDPMPEALEAGQRRHVLGVQANLWSEHIRTPERLAYMAFPRAAAVAELAWSPPERRSWPDFLERLAVQFGRYRSLAMPFSTSAFDVRVEAAYVDGSNDVAIELSNQAGFGIIRYSTDGSEVTPQSERYEAPLTLPPSATLATAVFHDGIALAQTDHGGIDLLAARRYSQQLDLCSEGIALQLEDDAPAEGDRSVFLIDIMNPCWVWPDVDLSRLQGIDVAVGQLPFNFQIGDLREQIELRRPDAEGGELEVRAGGCDGDVVAKVPLREAAGNDAVTTLSVDVDRAVASRADLCFRFNTATLEPMWAIESVTLRRAPNDGS